MGDVSANGDTDEVVEKNTDDFYAKNPMWTELMDAMKCVIDDHITRLLDLNGYRTYASLKKFEKDDIKEIEVAIQEGLLDRVESKDHHLYLGSVKKAEKFKFLLGEKRLILSIVDYVQKNHKEKDIPLGKSLGAYPLFGKRTNSSSNYASPKKRLKTGDNTVVSLNFPSEVVDIKKLLKDYFIRNDYPSDYHNSVPTMTINVETMEKGDGSASLSAHFDCPFCNSKGVIGGYREPKKTWSTSNFTRHFTAHKKKKTKLRGTVDSRFFQRRGEMGGTIREDPTEDVDGDLMSLNSSGINQTFQDGSQTTPSRLGSTSSLTLSNQNLNVVMSEEENNIDQTSQDGSQTTPSSTVNFNVMREGENNINLTSQDSFENTPPRSGSTSPLTLGNVKLNVVISEGENIIRLPDSISIASDKYSRGQRNKRALGRHTPDQLRITAFFPILNQIEQTIKTNEVMIAELKARCSELTKEKLSSNFKVSYLLQLLMETAQKNVNRKNHGQRYEEEIKLFAVYLFIIGGRMLYEFLLANLPDSLPSIAEVERILKQNSNPVIEGVFRFQELKDFLTQRELPLKVCISEDGTRIQQKFLYDSTSNQIIGPTLPLADNGVPVTGSFPAFSAAAIATHLKTTLSSTAYAIMAQPLRKGSPAFCLVLFGTTNCFSSEHAYRRWFFIREELAKLGVEVECFASDGDPKMLAAMHSLLFGSNGKFKESWKDWFFAETTSTFTVIQDPIHTINKFRSRLNPSTFMPIGNFTVSRTHLKLLVKQEPQEKHGLTDQDLNSADKMNFNASLKICSSRVTDLMASSVTGSDATVAYLSNMRHTMEACLDENLSAAERIYRIWHCAFFLRYWKLWLQHHKSYTMENFITSNLFVCVEVIAHALLIILIKFRDASTPEFFLFNLFSSQACESFFRLARSMTSTESTVINFSMKEFLTKVRRVDMLHHCSSKLMKKLEFPREKRKKLLGIFNEKMLQGTYLPTDYEIVDIVMAAKKDAIGSLKKLGVKLSSTSLAGIRSYLSAVRNFEDELEMDTMSSTHAHNSGPNTNINFEEEDIPLDILAAFPSPDDMTSLDPIISISTNDDELLPPNSIFTMVPKTGGGFVKIRKSTFCWLIASNGLKLSSDRLQRVRQIVCSSVSNMKIHLNKTDQEPFVSRKEEIEVGDWCIFKKSDSSHQCALVLGFRYLSGGSRSFTLPRAPVNPPSDITKVRGIGCLCSRYNCDSNGNLTMVKSSVQCYINIEKYVATISSPICLNSNLCLSPQVLTFLKQ